jgi:hypothetical protein
MLLKLCEEICKNRKVDTYIGTIILVIVMKKTLVKASRDYSRLTSKVYNG